MASSAGDKTPVDSIKVFQTDEMGSNPLAAEDDLDFQPPKVTRSFGKRSGTRRPWSTATSSYRSLSADSRHYGGVDPQTLIGHSIRFQDWLSQRNVKNVQEKADVEAKATKGLYTSILDTEDTFVKDIDDLLLYKDGLELRKKEILHKKWNERVHEPIRKHILGEMDGPAYTALARRKRQLYKEFIEFTNKKGHVFLDTFPPDEYFPFSMYPRPYHLRVATKRLQDPLLSQERARSAEDRTILQCETGNIYSDRDIQQVRLPPLPLVPLGRQGTECKTWIAMPLKDIESPVRHASRETVDPNVEMWRRMKSDLNASHFSFDEWGSPVNQTIVDKEMQVQKRKPCTTHASLSKTNMTRHMMLQPPDGMEQMPIVPQQMNQCANVPMMTQTV
ncbi:protein FAM228B-like isoform X2 [Lineus longissimus]|uniref:protein FAM228B-like isoform X2 n=1 Tax=Lineus longissimus TaxID=88925 RepID=UPI002B4EE894